MTKAKTKPVIAVDLDDVLSSQNEAVRQFVNEHYDLNLTPEDYTVDGEYWAYWREVWGVSHEEGEKRLDAFHKAEGTMRQVVFPYVDEVLKELKRDFTLIIVTGRKSEFAEITHRWLNEHLPGIFEDVKFVDLWSKDKKITKAHVCKEIGAGYLIDDNEEHCKLATHEGVTALLFGEYGWNRRAKPAKNVHRTKDWLEVKKFFDEQRQLQN